MLHARGAKSRRAELLSQQRRIGCLLGTRVGTGTMSGPQESPRNGVQIKALKAEEKNMHLMVRCWGDLYMT